MMRAVADTMALISTNIEEQQRLEVLARQTTPASSSAIELELSGVKHWLSAESLPAASNACQVRVFGAWELRVWSQELEDSTVALFKSNKLQFAWQGSGLITTGPLKSGEAGTDMWTRFDGPPAGTDLDGDGVPDVLIYDYTGGMHCCATVKHIMCSDPPVLTAQISAWHHSPSYRDIDGDGRYEMIICDSTYAYWNTSYAGSPKTEAIFRIRNGHYELAGDLMRQQAPSPGQIQATIKELHGRLSRYDEFIARRKKDPDSNRKLTEEEQADEDFFLDQGWHDDSLHLSSPVWDFLLELIYSGQVESAVNALDSIWPASKPNKVAFANDFLGIMQESWYAPHLPWFNEVEKEFAHRYPPPSSQ